MERKKERKKIKDLQNNHTTVIYIYTYIYYHHHLLKQLTN